MGVTIHLLCGGCDATVDFSVRVKVRVISSGRLLGGVLCDKIEITRPNIETDAPEGWVVFDPFTHCTYCSTCWESIVGTKDGE